MSFFQFLPYLFPVLLPVLAEHGQGTFVFTGVNLLEVDIVFFQQAMKVRDLCQYTDRTKYRERRGNDLIGNTGHHITPTGGDLVYCDCQLDGFVGDPFQL